MWRDLSCHERQRRRSRAERFRFGVLWRQRFDRLRRIEWLQQRFEWLEQRLERLRRIRVAPAAVRAALLDRAVRAAARAPADSSGSGSSSGGFPSPACPSTSPAENGTCPIVNAVCEYGDSPSPACNQLFTCESTGWELTNTGTCATGTCPGSYGGGSCSVVDLDCEYAEGVCDCTLNSLEEATWNCYLPSPVCPLPRPRVGSACMQSGPPLGPPLAPCDYGACSGGVELQCEGGYWQETVAACEPPDSFGGRGGTSAAIHKRNRVTRRDP